MRQTTLSVEVTHFTKDERNISALLRIRSVHRGPTWEADKTALQTPIAVSALRMKGGHIKIQTLHVPNVWYAPDLDCQLQVEIFTAVMQPNPKI